MLLGDRTGKCDGVPLLRWRACSAVSKSFATSQTVGHLASLSVEFSRQEYWSGLPFHFLLQGIFLTQGSNSHLLHLLSQEDSLSPSHLGNPLLRLGHRTVALVWVVLPPAPPSPALTMPPAVLPAALWRSCRGKEPQEATAG